MSGDYYYLVSFLPTLSFGKAPEIKIADFLSYCEDHIASDKFQILERIFSEDFPQESDLKILDEWLEVEKKIRNELVVLRANELKKNPLKYIRDRAEPPTKQAKDIFYSESPLDAEIALDSFRWANLENLEVEHYFDLEKIIIYALKLKILSKESLINPDLGEKKLEAILNSYSPHF